MTTQKLTQADAVYQAMKGLEGVATFGQLNVAVPKVSGVVWNTKTPFASIRRIVQDDKRFFKIRPGLWALEEQRKEILERFSLSPTKPEQPQEEFDHGYYQGLLVEIGKLRERTTFVPAQDKNRQYLGKPLGNYANLTQIPKFTYDAVLSKAATIDVIWFNRRDFPDSLFEVEHSTDFKNSLLKFIELQDFYTEFYIVADAIREREYRDKIALDAFHPIRQRVKFRSYELVSEWHTQEYKATIAANTFLGSDATNG